MSNRPPLGAYATGASAWILCRRLVIRCWPGFVSLNATLVCIGMWFVISAGL
jgi:hypothetical protein